jgi:hypothetical protein
MTKAQARNAAKSRRGVPLACGGGIAGRPAMARRSHSGPLERRLRGSFQLQRRAPSHRCFLAKVADIE